MSNESLPAMPRVLIVDDDPDILKAARLLLARHGIDATPAADPDDAWVALAGRRFDAVLLDLNFARGRTTGEEGFALLDRLTAHDPALAVVVVTGHSGIAVAVRAMRAGATDFVVKPWSNERLFATVDRAVAVTRARRATSLASGPVERPALLGEDAAIARIRTLIARIAPTAASALVRGPAGSGKSLVARLIAGEGADWIDGAALVAPPGAGDAALVIERIDAVAAGLQLDLARALDGRRVVATSALDRVALRAAVSADLLDRVATVEIDLPPLAARGSDVVLLARHFLRREAARFGRPPLALGGGVADAIAADRWPDGVRGLRRACERAALLGDGPDCTIADLGIEQADDPQPRAAAADLNLARGEKTLIAIALRRHGFNVSRAAAELGLTRAALYRRMGKHGL